MDMEELSEAIGKLRVEAKERVEIAGLESLAELEYLSALASLGQARLHAERARVHQARALASSARRW